MPKEKQLEFYDPKDVEGEGLEMEVAKVPLQEYVAPIRRSLCSGVNRVKGDWSMVKRNLQHAVSSTRVQTTDALKGVGVERPALLAQYVSVGGSALVGYVLARKRSLFARVLYPLMGAGLVGVAFHLSSAQHRREAWSSLEHAMEEVRSNWRKERSKSKQQSSPGSGPKD